MKFMPLDVRAENRGTEQGRCPPMWRCEPCGALLFEKQLFDHSCMRDLIRVGGQESRTLPEPGTSLTWEELNKLRQVYYCANDEHKRKLRRKMEEAK